MVVNGAGTDVTVSTTGDNNIQNQLWNHKLGWM
jgi:hypothetical protein